MIHIKISEVKRFNKKKHRKKVNIVKTKEDKQIGKIGIVKDNMEEQIELIKDKEELIKYKKNK